MGFINKAIRSAGKAVRVQVASSANDGWWWPGVTFDSADTGLSYGVNSNWLQHGFIRWTGITIPAGVTIQEAYVEFYLNSYSGSPTGNIYFNDSATPTAPTTYELAEAKTLTTAYTALNPSLSAGWKQFNVKSIIEELLASYTSYTHGSMMALLRGTGTGTNAAYVRTYDYSGNTHGAILMIKWY